MPLAYNASTARLNLSSKSSAKVAPAPLEELDETQAAPGSVAQEVPHGLTKVLTAARPLSSQLSSRDQDVLPPHPNSAPPFGHRAQLSEARCSEAHPDSFVQPRPHPVSVLGPTSTVRNAAPGTAPKGSAAVAGHPGPTSIGGQISSDSPAAEPGKAPAASRVVGTGLGVQGGRVPRLESGRVPSLGVGMSASGGSAQVPPQMGLHQHQALGLPGSSGGGLPGPSQQQPMPRTVSFAQPEVKGPSRSAAPAPAAAPESSKAAGTLSPPRGVAASASSGPGLAAAAPAVAAGTRGLRLRAEGLMAPPASDASTLRRQVAALQADLEAHIQGEGRLQQVNVQLRQRLELYQKQNHENVDRAEVELSALHTDMERALELQSQLAERAATLEREKHYVEAALEKKVTESEMERLALQARIEDMTEAVRTREKAVQRAEELRAELDGVVMLKGRLEGEVAALSSEAQFVKRKAEEYSGELRQLLQREQKDELIQRCGRRALQRRAFLRFQEGVLEQQRMATHEGLAGEFLARKRAQRGFRAWVLATRRSATVSRANATRNEGCIREAWVAWRQAMEAARMAAVVRVRGEVSVLTEAMERWRSFVAERKLHLAREAVAERHWRLAVIRRAVGLWLAVVARSRFLVADQERRLEAAAVHAERGVMRRALGAWTQWLEEKAKPKAAARARAEAQYWRSLCGRAWWAWQDAVECAAVKAAKHRMAEALSRKSVIRRAWAVWEEILRLRAEGRAMKQAADRLMMEHKFREWRQVVREVRSERLEVERGARMRRVLVLRHVLRGWRCEVFAAHRARALNTVALSHFLGALRRSAWDQWRQGVAVQKAERRIEREGVLARMRDVFSRWKEFHGMRMAKRQLERRAELHYRHVQIRTLRAMVAEWAAEAAERQWVLRVAKGLQRRQERSVLRVAFYGWKRNCYEVLREAHLALHNQFVENQGKCEEHITRISAVDLENLQLIDRLHEMSSEISGYRAQLAEGEVQQDDLQRAAEEGAVVESSLRAEADALRGQLKGLEEEVERLQRVLATRGEEDAGAEVRHSLELQEANQRTSQVMAELQRKTGQLESCEQALREVRHRLDSQAAVSEGKLASAFEIAASLRKVLEEKEARVATLEQEQQRAEIELSEVQRRLTAANAALRETVDIRDARVRELEAHVQGAQAQMHQQEAEAQELTLALEKKAADVRRLEYEVRLLSEREESKTSYFLSSLTRGLPQPSHAPRESMSAAGAASPTIAPRETGRTASSHDDEGRASPRDDAAGDVTSQVAVAGDTNPQGAVAGFGEEVSAQGQGDSAIGRRPEGGRGAQQGPLDRTTVRTISLPKPMGPSSEASDLPPGGVGPAAEGELFRENGSRRLDSLPRGPPLRAVGVPSLAGGGDDEGLMGQTQTRMQPVGASLLPRRPNRDGAVGWDVRVSGQATRTSSGEGGDGVRGRGSLEGLNGGPSGWGPLDYSGPVWTGALASPPASRQVTSRQMAQAGGAMPAAALMMQSAPLPQTLLPAMQPGSGRNTGLGRSLGGSGVAVVARAGSTSFKQGPGTEVGAVRGGGEEGGRGGDEPGGVSNLQEEIQRLQARIMNRLREGQQQGPADHNNAPKGEPVASRQAAAGSAGRMVQTLPAPSQENKYRTPSTAAAFGRTSTPTKFPVYAPSSSTGPGTTNPQQRAGLVQRSRSAGAAGPTGLAAFPVTGGKIASQ